MCHRLCIEFCHFVSQVNASWFKNVSIFVLENKMKILRKIDIRQKIEICFKQFRKNYSNLIITSLVHPDQCEKNWTKLWISCDKTVSLLFQQWPGQLWMNPVLFNSLYGSAGKTLIHLVKKKNTPWDNISHWTNCTSTPLSHISIHMKLNVALALTRVCVCSHCKHKLSHSLSHTDFHISFCAGMLNTVLLHLSTTKSPGYFPSLSSNCWAVSDTLLLFTGVTKRAESQQQDLSV